MSAIGTAATRPYAVRVADYLRIGEVAQRAGVSVDTLRRWESEGRITFERRGNQRVLPASELAGFLKLAGRQRQDLERAQPVHRRRGLGREGRRDGEGRVGLR